MARLMKTILPSCDEPSDRRLGGMSFEELNRRIAVARTLSPAEMVAKQDEERLAEAKRLASRF